MCNGRNGANNGGAIIHTNVWRQWSEQWTVVWLKRILKDLGVPITDPIRIFCDNMSSIYLARNPVFHARTKHIEVHYHFICERAQAREIDLQHVSTNLQVTDIFTKALGIDKLGQFAWGLELTPSSLSSLRGVL